LRQTEILEAIPKAWQQLLSEPDQRLIDLVAEEVESISGHRPDSDTVASHITKQLGPPPRVNTAKTPAASRISGTPGELRQRTTRLDPQIAYTKGAGNYRGNFTNTQAKGFSFEGDHHPVSSYIEILLTLSNFLRSKHGALFDDKVLTLTGNKRRYFSREADLWKPKQLDGEPPLFAESNLASGHIVKICNDIIQRLGYDPSTLSIDFERN
jgi:hypothetical protein